jgi:DnaJ-class molecular chaperone
MENIDYAVLHHWQNMIKACPTCDATGKIYGEFHAWKCDDCDGLGMTTAPELEPLLALIKSLVRRESARTLRSLAKSAE